MPALPSVAGMRRKNRSHSWVLHLDVSMAFDPPTHTFTAASTLSKSLDSIRGALPGRGPPLGGLGALRPPHPHLPSSIHFVEKLGPDRGCAARQPRLVDPRTQGNLPRQFRVLFEQRSLHECHRCFCGHALKAIAV